jgi:hypothetical protein
MGPRRQLRLFARRLKGCFEGAAGPLSGRSHF